MSVRVITDSSARLPDHIVHEYAITTVALHVLVDDHDYAEGIDALPAHVWTSAGATTSGASPADMQTALADAVASSNGDGVVIVCMSRKLSGTWNAARHAAQQFPGKVRVVDSRSAGLAVGFAAIAAAQAARAGADLDRAYEAAIRSSSTSETLLCVGDMDALRRGGRISAATRLFGSALSIKPILRVVDGSLAPAGRHRTRSKSLSAMIDAAVVASDHRAATVGVMHADADEAAHDVAQQLTGRLDAVTSTIVTDLGPVIGTHVGVGTVGIALGFDLGALS